MARTWRSSGSTRTRTSARRTASTRVTTRWLSPRSPSSVSVAPFSELARRYGEDLAIVWIDAHPDVGTPHSEYPGYHAMAVATLTELSERGAVLRARPSLWRGPGDRLDRRAPGRRHAAQRVPGLPRDGCRHAHRAQ